MWQKTVQWKKYNSARKFLEESLFVATPALAKAILHLRREYCRFMEMSFVDVSHRDNWHLFYFNEAQMLSYERTRDALIEFRSGMTDLLCG